MLRKVLFAASAALVLASSASAAIVNLTMDLSTPGTWNLYANDSTGDNFGIASYSAVINGATSVDNKTLNLLAGSGPGGVGATGFGTIRSADNPAVIGSTTVSGSQDTVTPSPNLIRGFGQENNSLSGKGITDLINPSQTPPSEGNPWTASYLLATGTRQGTTPVTLTLGVIDTFVNVFTAATGTAVTGATITSVPEPATISMIGLALVGCVGFTRRRSA